MRWEYGDGFGGAAKGKPLQALAAVRALMSHATDVGAGGWMLCGDFNSRPDDAAYRLITEGSLALSDPTHPGAPITSELRLPETTPALTSAFRACRGAEPLFTRKKDSPGSQFTLDYVFVGGALVASDASFGPGAEPFTGDGVDLPYLPCAAWPSDHLPLVVDLAPTQT